MTAISHPAGVLPSQKRDPHPQTLKLQLNTLHLLDLSPNFRFHHFGAQLRNYAHGKPRPQRMARRATPVNNTKPRM